MKRTILMVMALAVMLLIAHITEERAYALQQKPMDPQSITSSPYSRSENLPDVAHKLEMLEYKLTVETKASEKRYEASEKRYEDFSKSVTFIMTILSIFVAILTLFSIYKSLQQHKDYISERTFYTEHIKRTENRDKPFEDKQLDNIVKMNAVIGLVEKTFDLQHKREESQSNLVDKLRHMETIIDAFEKEAEEKYSDAKELIFSLADVKAMDWPRLSDEALNISYRARIKFDEISKIVLQKEEERNPYELAKVFQLIGISAYYSNDIASAFKLLGASEKIYETKPPRPDDTKSRAYTKHFLGVAVKNWRKTGDVPGGNVIEAYGYAMKADEIVKNDPKQFLIPVTLAEIMSYSNDKKEIAVLKTDEIIQRFSNIMKTDKLDLNQHSLYVRILLLRGNLEMMEGRFAEAENYYSMAHSEDEKNVYTILSLLHAKKHKGDVVDIEEWINALSLLESLGVTKKRETVTRIIAIVWAIIASHEGKDEFKKETFLKELNANGSTLSRIANREPLFFSPLSKNLEEYKTLKSNLCLYLENR